MDTRADVYGLGALLYELLTGSPPFARADLQKAGLVEMLRVIREDEPPRPSTRVSTAAGKPNIAAARGTDPEALTGLLRSDLDWVVMKALDKDRGRRYETAAGFAADVERYLAGEAVQAAPPGGLYRLRKFTRRHRPAVIVAGLLLLVLMAGAAGTTVGLVRADAARREAVAQRQVAEEERARADDARRAAEAVAEFLRKGILGHSPTALRADERFAPDPHLTVREALGRAAAEVDGAFAGRPAVEAAVRRSIGEAYSGFGDHTAAVAHLSKAAALLEPPAGAAPGSAAVQAHLDANRSLGVASNWAKDFQAARPILERVLDGRVAAFGRDHPTTLGAVQDLAELHRGTADRKERNRLLRWVIESRTRTLPPGDPAVTWAEFDLAFSNRDVGRIRELLPALERLAEEAAGRLDHGALEDIGRVASAHLLVGRLAEAVAGGERYRDGCRVLHGPESAAALWAEVHLAECYRQAGRLADVIGCAERARAGWVQTRRPDSNQVLGATVGLAEFYHAAGRTADAVRMLDEAVPVIEALLAARRADAPRWVERAVPALRAVGHADRADRLRRTAEAAR